MPRWSQLPRPFLTVAAVLLAAGATLVSTTLVERNGRTTLTCTILYDSRETRDSVLKSGMERGVVASYDRLESILAELPAS